MHSISDQTRSLLSLDGLDYCEFCGTVVPEREIEAAEVMRSVTVSVGGELYDSPKNDDIETTISLCRDCVSQHSEKEMTEKLIAIAETK